MNKETNCEWIERRQRNIIRMTAWHNPQHHFCCCNHLEKPELLFNDPHRDGKRLGIPLGRICVGIYFKTRSMILPLD